MNPKIKFSNWYWKFPDDIENGSVVKLIQVLKVHYNDLSEYMIQYDATYTRNHHVKEYKLPKTDLILLLLKQKPNSMFTVFSLHTTRSFV